MPDQSPLDLAQITLTALEEATPASPVAEAARLQYFSVLADTEIFVLLEQEAQGAQFAPQVFAVSDGQFALGFDAEDRLAAFAGGPAPYAALPGRVLAHVLAEAGLGLGVNLGTVAESMLPAQALEWLSQHLAKAGAAAPVAAVLRAPFSAPVGFPEALMQGLVARMARFGPLAQEAWVIAPAPQAHLLIFVGADDAAGPALAKMASEAVMFAGLDARDGAGFDLTVAVWRVDDPRLADLRTAGLGLPLPEPEATAGRSPTAPGSDPARPPILR